jgi:hypothetical protein
MVKIIPVIFLLAGGCKVETPGPVLVWESNGGKPVAEVAGIPIPLSRVDEACKETGFSPAQATRKLIDEIVLAKEAEKKNFLDDEHVIKIWKKVLVQKILEEEVDGNVPESSVSLEDIKAYYIANYQGRGVLLEDAWRDIRAQILAQRRSQVYQQLIKKLETENKAHVYYDKLELLK